jgi:diguanylate cyclase (GGDEF)-like protein
MIPGFDLGSEVVRSGALVRARSTGFPAATPPLALVEMQRPGGGMMTFMPVDGRSHDDNQGAPPIAGVVLGVYDTATMIENLLAGTLRLTDFNVYVFDPNGPAGKRLIDWHSPEQAPVPAEAVLLAGLHWQGTVKLADQNISAIFTPSSRYSSGNSGWTPLAVLAAGLIITGSLILYLWFSLQRTQQLEALTRNLRETTAELGRKGARLDHIVRHDSLTGLVNRSVFRDDVAAGLRRSRRGEGLAVLYLDLDRFKTINDTLGHPVGDLILCQVADRLREAVRDADAIARLGGDEFGIAQFGSEQPRSAEALARRLIETLSRPYSVPGRQVAIGVSVGITLAGRDDGDVDQVLRRADVALYAAKRDGRGTWRCFEANMDREALARHGLEMDLREALETDQLELYYQPQVRVSDGRTSGFEALLRWHHPQRGFVLPGDFIACAEETGLIGPIGEWVVRTALAEAASWPKDVRVSVNLSPYQLARDTLAATVEAALAETGQSGDRLELEITETALLQNYAAAEATLTRLRSLGVSIAMDDFGTGYASLSHLRSFPFDRLKIDQSFIFAMLESPEGAAIVTAILQLAAGLHIATTAEGVETRAQLDRLAAEGCDEAQGYLFSRPQPACEVPRLLRAWHLDGISG